LLSKVRRECAFGPGFPASAIRFADDREGCQFTVTVYRKEAKSSVKMGVIPAIPDNAGKNVGNGSPKTESHLEMTIDTVA